MPSNTSSGALDLDISTMAVFLESLNLLLQPCLYISPSFLSLRAVFLDCSKSWPLMQVPVPPPYRLFLIDSVRLFTFLLLCSSHCSRTSSSVSPPAFLHCQLPFNHPNFLPASLYFFWPSPVFFLDCEESADTALPVKPSKLPHQLFLP